MRTKIALIQLLIGLLILASISIPISAAADSEAYDSKDEVIYGNLDAHGNIKNMYVVNTLHLTKPGKVTDYGSYIEVRNLTDLTDIDKVENEVHIQTDQEEFYYQGELQNQPLPWDISITYVLDGEEMDPGQLVGKSGNLEIQITTSANESRSVNPLFFEHFLLQVSLTLNPKIFKDIQAPKGVEANEGTNKQIAYTVLPEKEEVLIMSARVTDFEMDPIDISAIPANIAIDDPDISDMTGNMRSLSDAIKGIHSGVSELSNGAAILTSGTAELSAGSSDYQSGINKLNQSSGGLIDGSKQIRSALRQVNESMHEVPEIDMSKLHEMKELPKGLRELAQQLRDFSGLSAQLDAAISAIPSNVDDGELDQLYGALHANDIDTRVLDQMVESYESAQIVKEINKSISGEWEGRITQLATHLEEAAAGIDEALGSLDQLSQLTDLIEGLKMLSSEYETFHQGLETYTSGVHSLATSYEELDAGIKDLTSGTSSLKDGISDLHKGTQKLQAETSDLPSEMQSQVDEFMAEYDFSNFEPASFVSDKNDKIGVVQFVFKTEAIEIKEVEDDKEEIEEPKNIWDRFINLFKGN